MHLSCSVSSSVSDASSIDVALCRGHCMPASSHRCSPVRSAGHSSSRRCFPAATSGYSSSWVHSHSPMDSCRHSPRDHLGRSKCRHSHFLVQQESVGFLAFEVGQERVLEVPHLPSVASSRFGSLSSGVSWPQSSSCSPSRCNDPLEGRQKEHSSAKLLKVVSWIRDICDPASAPSESCKNGFSCRS